MTAGELPPVRHRFGWVMAWGGLAAIDPYRRRAVFGAGWRWQRAERWWPRLVGPGRWAPGTRAGFADLSSSGRRLFVTSLLVVWIVRLAVR